jgi:GNAT superfamily N-acetyltransferase
LGISQLEAIDFDFNDVEIRNCKSADYKLLLSKYHYLTNGGRGGIAYGAHLNNELIAICIFSPLVRQNILIDGYKSDEVRELSRFCIHPKYQKQNFASWFISRCIKKLDEKYRCIISYCDTTYNHDGAIYKACNFIQDKEVPPDYWYIDKDGWVMHKKTLYERACLMQSTEREYAEKHGFKKTYGFKKLRFIYHRVTLKSSLLVFNNELSDRHRGKYIISTDDTSFT